MEPDKKPASPYKPGVYQGVPPSQGGATPPPVRIVRTMRDDIAEAISKQNETATSIALAEARKQERSRAEALAKKTAEAALQAAEAPVQKPRPRVFIFSVFVLALVILALLSYKLFAPAPTIISLPLIGPVNFGKTVPEKQPEVSSLPTASLASSLISPQYEKRFLLGSETPSRVFETIGAERTGGVLAGSIKNLFFMEGSVESANPTSAPAKRVFTFMGASAPDIILRTLEPRFMMGFFGEEGSIATPFVILKISDQEAGRAGMLIWEPSLAASMDALFGTKIKNGGWKTAPFRDSIVAGKDARVIFSAGSVVLLAYAIPDTRTIVIAGSQSALEHILIRLLKK